LKKAKTGKEEDKKRAAQTSLQLPVDTSNNSTALQEIDMALTPSAIPGGELDSHIPSKVAT